MLTLEYLRDYCATPRPWLWHGLASLARANARVAGSRLVVEAQDNLPCEPSLICTNSTHDCDFIVVMRALDRFKQRTVHVSKGKNFHRSAMAWIFERAGVIPLPSRAYFLMVDFGAVIGRRPSAIEYRVLRDHVDHGTSLPTGEVWDRLQQSGRTIAGLRYDSTYASYGAAILALYERAAQESLRLLRSAQAAGFHIHIYPEGTVSPRLGEGRSGAIQVAHALGMPIVPLAMSGCPRAFLGATPLALPATVVARFAPHLLVQLPPDHRAFEPASEVRNRAELQRYIGLLMASIDSRLEPQFRRDPRHPGPKKGLLSHL
jgi:1-acyl-sn-glycerol-3-phosphate acyltransferase